MGILGQKVAAYLKKTSEPVIKKLTWWKKSQESSGSAMIGICTRLVS